MNSGAWYDILDLALDYGWNPLGTVHDKWSLSPVGRLPNFDLEQAETYLPKAADAVGDFIEKVIAQWQQIGL